MIHPSLPALDIFLCAVSVLDHSTELYSANLALRYTRVRASLVVNGTPRHVYPANVVLIYILSIDLRRQQAYFRLYLDSSPTPYTRLLSVS